MDWDINQTRIFNLLFMVHIECIAKMSCVDQVTLETCWPLQWGLDPQTTELHWVCWLQILWTWWRLPEESCFWTPSGTFQWGAVSMTWSCTLVPSWLSRPPFLITSARVGRSWRCPWQTRITITFAWGRCFPSWLGGLSLRATSCPIWKRRRISWANSPCSRGSWGRWRAWS